VSALRDALEDLGARRRAAERAEDWHEVAVLAHLVDIADYTARIGDVTDSAHYRAEKAGPLLDAAIRIQEDVFLAAAAWPAEDTPLDRAVVEATKVLGDVAGEVRQVLWDSVQNERDGDGPVAYRSTARSLIDAVGELSRWADAIAASAVPDPDEEGSW
jgi:hypothetical protein